MANQRDDADRGPKMVTYVYDYALDPAGDVVAVDCPDCGGTGKVLLLVSARSCKNCGGTGKVGERYGLPARSPDAPAEPALGGHWVTEYTFDAKDELIGEETKFVPDERNRARPTA